MKKIHAFSLLELLLIISIISILVTLSIPTFNNFQIHTKSKILREQLLRAIEQTRTEAIARAENVILTGDFNSEIIIQTKTKIISRIKNKSQGNLYARLFPAGQKNIIFSPSGMLYTGNGTFWYCSKNSKQPVWAIVINRAGRVREVVPDQTNNLKC